MKQPFLLLAVDRLVVAVVRWVPHVLLCTASSPLGLSSQLYYREHPFPLSGVSWFTQQTTQSPYWRRPLRAEGFSLHCLQWGLTAGAGLKWISRVGLRTAASLQGS